MRIHSYPLAIAITLALTGCNPFEDKPIESLELSEVTAMAENGNSEAQFNLGQRYDDGKSVEVDDKQAVIWYRKAAEQGYSMAQYYLGIMYANGEGVALDNKEAAAWYSKAAAQGQPNAQYYLGLSYELGRGVTQDNAKAITWYLKSAEQGFANAQYRLATMYEAGLGVPVDPQQAVHWYTKAAEQGNADAEFSLGLLYHKGLGVPEDFDQAASWYRKAIAHGNKLANDELVLAESNFKLTGESTAAERDVIGGPTATGGNEIVIDGQYISVPGVPKFRWGETDGRDMSIVRKVIQYDFDNNDRNLTLRILREIAALSDKYHNHYDTLSLDETLEFALAMQAYIQKGIGSLEYKEISRRTRCTEQVRIDQLQIDHVIKNNGPAELIGRLADQSIADHDKCTFDMSQRLPNHLYREYYPHKSWVKLNAY